MGTSKQDVASCWWTRMVAKRGMACGTKRQKRGNLLESAGAVLESYTSEKTENRLTTKTKNQYKGYGGSPICPRQALD